MRLEPRQEHLHTPFGGDRFGRTAERIARFFGTPKYIVGQTLIVLVWLAANAYLLSRPFDAYPFIALNLMFSTQAAYAAPLILLAQARQADRDKAGARAAEEHRAQISYEHKQLLEANTELTREIHSIVARKTNA